MALCRFRAVEVFLGDENSLAPPTLVAAHGRFVTLGACGDSPRRGWFRGLRERCGVCDAEAEVKLLGLEDGDAAPRMRCNPLQFFSLITVALSCATWHKEGYL